MDSEFIFQIIILAIVASAMFYTVHRINNSSCCDSEKP